jgi:cytochrome c peroxidase
VRMAPGRLMTLLVVVSCAVLVAAAHARDPSFGLPPLNLPAASDAQRELGRKLFFDRRLSINGTMSCGMCHVPEEGFTSNASQQALGLEGRSLKRNAPGLLNVAWQTALFHDGRHASLEALAWDPILHPHEMGNASVAQLLARMRRLDDYPRRFASAYPGRGMTRDTVASALAAYQRTLVAADSPFDRWRYGGQADALDGPAREGFALFAGKARCASCHVVGERDAAFTDGGFHVTGAGHALQAHYDVPLAPGEATRVPLDALAPFAFGVDADLGRFDITKQPRDRHAFKTPSLRNVSRTAPYMHDGSLATLDAVIAFYDRGGGAVEGRSALLQPLGLSAGEKAALRAFLESLESPHAAALVARARR